LAEINKSQTQAGLLDAAGVMLCDPRAVPDNRTGGPQVLWTRRLRIGSGLPQAPLLVKERKNFRAHVTLARNESPESWREGKHDDLVLAAALAAWMGERALPPLEDPEEETTITRLVLW
jgi:hypothetical protein